MQAIKELIKTVAKLRSPNGCPWDKEQTHKSLKRYLIEEAYETIDAIDNNNPEEIMEELGDVLLQVVLHSQIASEKKLFSFNKVAKHINKKMITRHPHVFSNVTVKNSDEVMRNWEIIKNKEKGKKKNLLDSVPKSLPALLKGIKISKKVAKEGFEWANEKELITSLKSEVKELEEAIRLKDKKSQTEELGDLLFMIVNLSRWYKIDPEETLNHAIKKFIGRFERVKHLAKINKKKINNLSHKELNHLWQQAKRRK